MTELLRELEEVVGLADSLRLSHHVCDDDWYSCPKSGECINDAEGDECNCGAEQHNAKLDDLRERLRTHHAEIAEAVRNARRWRVARNNTGDGLRLVRWDHSKPEELQVMFPSPTLCDSDADTAIDAHNSAREVGE